MARFDLTDFEWSVIEPLLPNKPRGVPRVDGRRVLNGIFRRLRTGAPWADIVARYRILKALSKAYDGDIQMIDSSSSRVHQHAANTKKRSRIPLHGRRAEGLPIDLKLTEEQTHDGRSADDMLGALVEGQILLADRAYDSNALRKNLKDRGAWANIKPMPNRRNVSAFSSYLHRNRNLVQRFFNKIKHYRAVATRYDKRADNFLAGPSSSPQSASGCAIMSR